MNYEHPELLDKLAAEYALGTLQGPARHRFERIMQTSSAARQATWKWERHLGELTASAETQSPSLAVWKAIKRQTIDAGQNANAPTFSFARLWSTAATAAALVLGLMLATSGPTQTEFAPSHIAQFADADSAPLWLITADIDAQIIKAKTINGQSATDGKSWELWIVPRDGAPISLGLLPDSGTSSTSLSVEGAQQFTNSDTLAISLEPAGGSPTGQPTGPIVHLASLLNV